MTVSMWHHQMVLPCNVTMTLEEGKRRKGSVLFVNMRVENMKDMLNFDEFSASKMIFDNCCFSRIRGITSSSAKLIFNEFLKRTVSETGKG